MASQSLVQIGKIEQRILLMRGEKVILDSDLAEFYGVSTKRLNEQVKRNNDAPRRKRRGINRYG